jgi:DNA-binding response OmpR family regulator
MTSLVIVEDNRDVAMLARVTLKSFFPQMLFEIHPYISDYMLTAEFWEGKSLALIDLMLPGRSGLELCRAIKARAPWVRTIVMSAVVDQYPEVIQCADVVLQKPADVDDLVNAIREGMK